MQRLTGIEIQEWHRWPPRYLGHLGGRLGVSSPGVEPTTSAVRMCARYRDPFLCARWACFRWRLKVTVDQCRSASSVSTLAAPNPLPGTWCPSVLGTGQGPRLSSPMWLTHPP
eukprot:scaffold910_cov396-Prasinococcus_capsulatus_cf.AAC.74